MEEWNNTKESSSKNTLEDFGKNNTEKLSKKGSLVLKIVIGIAAVLFIGGIVVFSQPVLRNQLYLTILSPKGYYIRTEYKNIKNITGKIADSYEERIKRLEQQKGGTKKNEADIKFDLDKTYTSVLGLDEVLPVEILISSTVDMENSKNQMGMEMKLGEEQFLGLNMLMNLEKDGYGDTYIQLPQFSSAYLYTGFNKSEIEDSEVQKDIENYQKVYSNYLNNPTSKKFLSNLIIRYGKLIWETPEEISLEKKADYSVNGITKKMTKVTISITTADTKEWCKKIVETAKKDSELKKELVRLEICEEDNYLELIGKMEEIFQEGEDDDSEQLIMDVWVDKNGDIVGREIYVARDNVKEGGFYYYTDNQDEIDYLEMACLSDEEDSSLIIKGNRKKEESGYKGDAILEMKNGNKVIYNVKLTFDEVALADKGYGSYNGNFTLETDQVADGKLQLTLVGGENKQDMKMEAVMAKQKICSIEINKTTQDCEKIVYPPEGTVYNTKKTEEIQEYMAGLDQTEINKLQKRVEEISAIFGLLSGNEEIEDLFSNMFSSTEAKEKDSDVFILKEVPETKEDLPPSVEVDENDFYIYEVSDEAVKENGEVSSAEVAFSGVTIEKNESKIESILQSVKGDWKKETTSKNTVYGNIGDYPSLNTSFLTLDDWAVTVEDDILYSVHIFYDTYSHEITSVTIQAKDTDITDKLVKGFLNLWEKDADKTYQVYKKQRNKGKNDEYQSFKAGVSKVFYSADKYGVYCTLEPNEDI